MPKRHLTTLIVCFLGYFATAPHAAAATDPVDLHSGDLADCYVQSATLNGKPLNRCWITYQEITAGGTLDFVLGASPNKAWGTGD